MVSHCLGNRLTDADKAVLLRRRLRFTLHNQYFSAPNTHFNTRTRFTRLPLTVFQSEALRMIVDAPCCSRCRRVLICHFSQQKQYLQTNKQRISEAFSPQANYTNWSTATCRRNLVPTFVDRGVSHGLRGGSPTVVNLSFLYRSRYFSFK
jgi:hypothetical protein